MSFEVDELIPVSKGGSPVDYDNVAAAHRCCNGWRGNKSVEEVLRIARGVRKHVDSLPQPFEDW